MFNFSMKLKIFFILLFLISISQKPFAQKSKVIKVIDSNLFQLEDSSFIKLAGVDVPNINNKNLRLQSVAVAAYNYAKSRFAGKKLKITFLENRSSDTSYSLVYITRKYPLLFLDFTKEYLQKGYGKFINNVKSTDSIKYKTAEQKAKEDKNGIWEIAANFDTLDQTFLGENLLSEDAIDSVEVAYSTEIPFLKKFSPTALVLTEAAAGPVFGVVGGIVGFGGGAIVGSLAGAKEWGMLGYVVLGGYVGYLMGSSYGVNLITRHGNRDVTYCYSLLSSFVGSLAGIVLTASFNNRTYKELARYSLLVFPVAASIIYSNLIAPEKAKAQNSVSYYNNTLQMPNNFFTHRNFYNSTKLFEVNLVRIYF